MKRRTEFEPAEPGGRRPHERIAARRLGWSTCHALRWLRRGSVALALTLTSCQQRAGTPDTAGHAAHAGSGAEAPAAGAAASAEPVTAEHAGHAAAAGGSISTPGTAERISAHTAAGGATLALAPSDAASDTTPSGYASFTLDPASARAVGLRLATVDERRFAKRVRTTGVVVLDETRTSHVHTKVRGWVETVNVDFVGKHVTAGAPLCTIYSQEVLAAELEFISVLEQAETATGLSGPLASAEHEARTQLIAAARRRLLLWDVPSAEIDRLVATREPRRTYTLNAPRSGIVIAKQALVGMFVDPSVELYLISDVSKLWLLADLYEADAPGVKLGDSASLNVEGLGLAPIDARIAFLPPTLDEATRTLKARFNLDNAGGGLRPGAFATVELNVNLGNALALPEDAVIHSGSQAIVFVAMGERIEPRSVKLGPLVTGYYAVQQGVRAGESVVVGAQFLVDSESRLRATSGKGPSHGGH